MGRASSRHLIRRLKAHRLVPEQIPVRIEMTQPRGSWRAVHAVTGADLGVGSAHHLTVVAADPDWRIRRDGDEVTIEPGGSDG